MKYICKFTSLIIKDKLFNDNNNQPYYIVHPFLTLPIEHINTITKDYRYDNDSTNRLLLSHYLINSSLINFDCPISLLATPYINSTIERGIKLLKWVKVAPNSLIKELPSYSINQLNNQLENFKDYLDLIESAKLSYIDKTSSYNENHNTNKINRLEAKIKQRLSLGKPLLNKETSEYLFNEMSIPKEDREFYFEFLSLPLNKQLEYDYPIVVLLDLESYCEEWFSLSSSKIIFLRYIRDLLETYIEIGIKLPIDYIKEDKSLTIEEHNNSIKKDATLSSTAKTLLYKIIKTSPIATPNITNKVTPIRANFSSLGEYLRALKEFKALTKLITNQ